MVLQGGTTTDGLGGGSDTVGSLVAGLFLAQQTASPATTTVDIEELASRSVHGLAVPNHDKLITGVSHPTGIFDC